MDPKRKMNSLAFPKEPVQDVMQQLRDDNWLMVSAIAKTLRNLWDQGVKLTTLCMKFDIAWTGDKTYHVSLITISVALFTLLLFLQLRSSNGDDANLELHYRTLSAMS